MNADTKPATAGTVPLQAGKVRVDLLEEDKPQETTFQAQLTGANIGLSSKNWRRTTHANPAPPPLLTTMSTMALLISKLKDKQTTTMLAGNMTRPAIRVKQIWMTNPVL
ncbi:hypothetical protein PCASD_08075 [Puccinia coronata f. sp. avenae]|uniref:Uncharacterized protein n=1 Tax=Puccinia coronata f. sp. avenae TaxID=200324 RepID=A0A2N5UZK5_9BASI|nr:hypothetical protein PCASD_08075 [Puccinia coronata f. sp. avenae]